MEKELLYSIIVPVYKVEKYIQDCLDSLRAQTYKNIEILLIDDGSPDKSGEICDKNASEDSRIKVIHKENGGVSSARFVGVQVARGEYILCVDSDDWISTDCVEKINNVVIQNGFPDVVTYGHYRMTEQGAIPIIPTVPAGFYSLDMKRETIFPQLIQNEKAEYYLPSVWGEVFCRDLIMPNMISSREAVIGEDMACAIPTIYHAKSMFVLDECLYYYRFNDESATKGKKVFPWNCPKILAEHLNSKMDLSDADFQAQVDRYVVHMLYNIACSQFNDSVRFKEIKKRIDNNLNDEFYKNVLQNCKFKLLSKGWIAHFILKKRLYLLMFLFNKIS